MTVKNFPFFNLCVPMFINGFWIYGFVYLVGGFVGDSACNGCYTRVKYLQCALQTYRYLNEIECISIDDLLLNLFN